MAFASTSKTMLNSNGDSEHPCLVADLSGKCSRFSPSSLMLVLGFLYIALIMLWIVPSTTTVDWVYSTKWCWILSKAFLCVN